MKLFEPIRIGPLELKNRMVMAPMATHYADESGAVTERLKNYYAERARGGVGLIIIESGYIHPLGRGGRKRLGLHDDQLIPGLKELVDLVHTEGARICSQLHHAGRQINVKATNGMYPVSASSIPAGMEGIVPRTLKIGEKVGRHSSLHRLPTGMPGSSLSRATHNLLSESPGKRGKGVRN